jgi:Calcineurin-like phosphoesterase
MPDAVWIVGDVQGWLEPLSRVLRDVGLIDGNAHWAGGDSSLAIAGDLVDRGPDGIGVIDLFMRLQSESNGRVHVVIGNHDVQLLAARRFGGEMLDAWLDTGGVRSDLENLSAAHVAWLSGLPAMISLGGAIVLHADAMFYADYGNTIEEVNAAFSRILHADSAAQFQSLLDQFQEHRAFSGSDGQAHAVQFLSTFGAHKVVHGHTPIARMLDVDPESVSEAYVYCGGRCVNVDPGIYLGGSGFAFRLA